MDIVNIDIDGVLAEQVEAYLSYAYDNYDKVIFSGFEESSDPVVTDCGKTFLDIVLDIYDTQPDLVKRMGSISGSQEVLNNLYDDYKLQIVTHRPLKVREETEKWLKDNNYPYDNLVMGEELDKHDVEGELIIEDFISNAIDYSENGKKAILFNQDYNYHKDISGYPGIIDISKDSSFTRKQLVSKPEVQWSLIREKINDLS